MTKTTALKNFLFARRAAPTEGPVTGPVTGSITGPIINSFISRRATSGGAGYKGDPQYSDSQHKAQHRARHKAQHKVCNNKQREVAQKLIPPNTALNRSPEQDAATATPTRSRMQVTGLNHFNITASAEIIESVKHFYCDILGLHMGPRAHLDHEGYWLYAGSFPIVHLSTREGSGGSITCQSYFNHISLNCQGLKRAIAQLKAAQIPYRIAILPDTDQTQVFVSDPAGIGVELTFLNETV